MAAPLKTALIYDFDGTLARGNMQEVTFIPSVGMGILLGLFIPRLLLRIAGRLGLAQRFGHVLVLAFDHHKG